jgi:WD40 repeat protein
MVADVANQPGALPLLQYALTELFERRDGDSLDVETYLALGGVAGAVSTRAERLFEASGADGRRAIRQVLLRLVTLGEGREDTRRRVVRSGLDALDVEPLVVDAVLDAFGRHRLLTFDRDPSTREPTVEIAHEALLGSWQRLRGWIDEAREDLRFERQVAQSGAEWRGADRDPSFLLRGARLDQAAAWAESTDLAVGAQEREFLKASIDHRAEERAAEEERGDHEARIERRSKSRLRALVAVLTAAALVASALTVVAKNQRDRAERESRIAAARDLAAAAVSNLEVDSQRSLLLALQAIATTREADGTVLPSAEQALHWAVQTDRLLLTVPGIGYVDLSPDGTRLLAAEDEGKASVYDTETGKRLLSVDGGDDEIGAVAYSPDGRSFVTSSREGDGSTWLWDAATGEQVLRLRLPDGEPVCCSSEFSPDADVLATQAFDGTTYLWDLHTGRQVSHVDASGPIAFSPDGKRILIGQGVYDSRALEGAHDAISLSGDVDTGEQPDAVWSPNGEMIARSDEGKVIVSDARTGERRFTIFPPLGGDFTQVDFGQGSDTLATGMGDGTAIVWDVSGEGAQEAFTLAGHGAAVRGMVFSSEGRKLVTGGADGTVRIWNVAPGGERESLAVPGRTGVAYSSDGRFLATGNADGAVRLYDAITGRMIRTLRGHAAGINAVDFSADGSRLASASFDGTVRIWDPASGTETVTLEGQGAAEDVAFSPEGDLIATTSLDGRIQIWSVGTGQPVRTMRDQDGSPAQGFFSVAFSADGTLLAGTLFPDTYIWRVEDGRILSRLRQPEYVLRVAFSPTGRRLATSAYDGSIRMWDVDTGRQIRAVPGNTVAQGLAFSPDGSRLATLQRDGRLLLWDARTLRQMLVIDPHIPTLGTGPVDKVAFSPNGTRLAAAGGDTVRVYILPIDELIRIARARLDRPFTEQECRQYLHLDACPSA